MGNNIGAQNTRFGPGSSMREQAALARETQALVQANQAYSYGDYMRGAEYEAAAQKAGMRAEKIHASRQRRGYTAAPWAHPQVNTVNPQLSGGSWPINVIGTPVYALNGQPTMTAQQFPSMTMMPTGQYGVQQGYNGATMLGSGSSFSGPLMLGGSTTALGQYYDPAVTSGFGAYGAYGGYPATVSPAATSISTMI